MSDRDRLIEEGDEPRRSSALEPIGKRWQEYAFFTWLIGLGIFIVVAAVFVFSWLGLYETKAVSSLHVPIFGLPTSCASISSASGPAPVTILSVPPPSAGGPNPAVASVLSSCASFAVIASSNDTMSTVASYPLLMKLQKIYPLAHYSTHGVSSLREPPSDPAQMGAYANNILKRAVVELDTIVGSLVQRKVSLIHLPSTSSLLVDAFLRGSFQYKDGQGQTQTVSFFNGRTSAQRWPGQRFSVSDTNANSVDATANVLRFADVVTAFDPTIILTTLGGMGVGGENTAVYFVNQQGDLGSNENFARLSDLMTKGAAPFLSAGGAAQIHRKDLTFTGMPATTIPTHGEEERRFLSPWVVCLRAPLLTHPPGTTASGSFSDAEIRNMVTEIDGVIATMSLNGQMRLVIVLNPASHYAAQVAFATAIDSALGKYKADNRVGFFGLSFAPRPGPGGFALQHIAVVRGVQAAQPRPTEDLEYLGFAADTTTLLTQIRSDLYVLDALKFAALCRTPTSSGSLEAVTGSEYQFAKATAIAELLHDDATIAALSAMPAGLDKFYSLNGRSSGRPAVAA